MPSFGKRSKEKRDSCHKNIQKILNEAIKYYDFTVIEGERSQKRQIKLFKAGKSKLDGINKLSKHQSKPSMAVDVAPWKKTSPHIDWKDEKSFYFLAGIIFTIAKKYNINIRWGGDWDRDFDFKNQKFIDLPHFELYKV